MCVDGLSCDAGGKIGYREKEVGVECDGDAFRVYASSFVGEECEMNRRRERSRGGVWSAEEIRREET